MKPHKFSVTERLRSFRFAFNGIRLMVQGEHNSWIQLIITIIVIIAGILLNVDKNEWIAIAFAIGLVLSLELVNSAIEKLADFVSPGKNELIKKAKDLSAAAVLTGSITAAVIGIIIFLPKIIGILR